jgi:hypothetical protein
MAYLLTLYTNPGDLVLEPFAGSGSTLVAAFKLGRRFIGIEKERAFYEVACRRLYEAYQEKNARRRLTIMTFPVNQSNDNQTDPDVESAIPTTPEPEHQNCEDTKTMEDLSCKTE